MRRPRQVFRTANREIAACTPIATRNLITTWISHHFHLIHLHSSGVPTPAKLLQSTRFVPDCRTRIQLDSQRDVCAPTRGRWKQPSTSCPIHRDSSQRVRFLGGAPSAAQHTTPIVERKGRVGARNREETQPADFFWARRPCRHVTLCHVDTHRGSTDVYAGRPSSSFKLSRLEGWANDSGKSVVV